MHIYISYSQSFRKAETRINEYNAQYTDVDGKRDLKQIIRPNHIYLLQNLIKLYCKKINTTPVMPDDEGNLEPLYTNRKILADKTGYSSKTIYNLLDRMANAGLINKVFKGDKFCFEVHISPDILSYQVQYSLAEINAQIEAQKIAEQKELVAAGIQGLEKSLPHNIDSRNSIKQSVITKVENEKGNLSFSVSDEVNKELLDEKHRQHGQTKIGKQIFEQKNEKKISGAADFKLNKAYILAVQLWQLCWSLLYSRAESTKYVSPSQMVHAQVYFAGKLLIAQDLENEYEQLQARIYLVDKYVSNGQKLGKSRYIPLPQSFFDDSKPDSFAKTEQWLDDSRKSQAKFAQLVQHANQEAQVYQAFRQSIDKSFNDGFMDLKTFTKAMHKTRNLTRSGRLENALHQLVINKYQNNEQRNAR